MAGSPLATTKGLNKLTARQVSLAKPGTHGDGGGLYFRVRGESRAGVFRFHRDGKPTEMGLRGWPAVTLAMARERAMDARRLVADGIDPIEARGKHRKALAPKPTFGQCTLDLIAGRGVVLKCIVGKGM